MDKIKIGIPRALLFYKYKDLWSIFFNELNCEVIYSPLTNVEILENGKKKSIDESCLSFKIFMGHVNYLIDKVDYILIPRIICLEKKEKLCTNFSAIYDIVNNNFKANFLDYNIDVEHGLTEKKAFIKLGKKLNKSYYLSKKAYLKALRISKNNFKNKFIEQNKLLNESTKRKILLVSHPYNTYDQLIGKVVVNELKRLDVDVIYADIFDKDLIREKYLELSRYLYWTYSKELLGSIMYYYNKVNGIILLSSFPCGPDSLVNEICMRKIKKPITNIIIDELSSEAGLQTRIESFIDIIKNR